MRTKDIKQGFKPFANPTLFDLIKVLFQAKIAF